MEAGKRTIRNYKTLDGREPFEEWFVSLKDKTVKAKVLERINRMRLGNFGDCKSLGEGIFETRIHYGSGYRLYFGEIEGVIVILLCGGTKRSQSRDINKAREYWQELKGRT
jgi:putative addiction module killer protein